MRMRGAKHRRWGLVLTAVLVVAAVAQPGAVARPVVVIPDVVTPLFEGRLKPTVLPKRGAAPVSLSLEGKIETRHDSTPPALRKLAFFGDKNLTLDLEGIPACGPKGVPNAPPPWKKCEDAIVGRGEAKIRISYPENTPMDYISDLAVYNGGTRGGVTRLWVHGFSPIQFPRAVVVPVKVRKTNEERYGWKGEARIPPISDGKAAILSFDLSLQKRILSARCPDGKHVARFEASFANEEVASVSNIRTCTGVDRQQSP